MSFDESTLDFIEKFRTPMLTKIFQGITFFGSAPVIIVMSFIVIAILLQNKKRIAALWFTYFTVVDVLITFIIKNLTQRNRPDPLERLIQQNDFSLPSGHSSSSIFLYGVMLVLMLPYISSKPLRVILTIVTALWILLIGFSRMYLGVHYPTDVAAGYLLGGTLLAIYFHRIHKNAYQSAKKNTR